MFLNAAFMHLIVRESNGNMLPWISYHKPSLGNVFQIGKSINLKSSNKLPNSWRSGVKGQGQCHAQPVLLNVIAQGWLERISSKLVQKSTGTEARTDRFLQDRGQRSECLWAQHSHSCECVWEFYYMWHKQLGFSWAARYYNLWQ